MKIMIDIPTAFEGEYNNDKFFGTLCRVLADIVYNQKYNASTLTGNYEVETLNMLKESFKSSIAIK